MATFKDDFCAKETSDHTMNMCVHEENTTTILDESSVVEMCGLSISVC